MEHMEQLEILLVEDNMNDAELTIRALRQHGLANHIVHAKDGEEALDFLFTRGTFEGRQPQYPQVVLLDLKLPKVDGFEVLKAMKSDLRTRTIPVVILTSSDQDRDIVNSYELGVNSYIVKPVNFESLVEAVQQFGMYWLLLNKASSGTGIPRA